MKYFDLISQTRVMPRLLPRYMETNSGIVTGLVGIYGMELTGNRMIPKIP
jgi:hypothetical protein